MARTANVFARVDPKIKAEAEEVLSKLGISMSTAMEMYLRQIALQKKIPFELKLEENKKPIALGALSEEQFNALMEQSMREYVAGEGMSFDEYKNKIYEKYGI